MRVLIIKSSSLGDIVHSLAPVRALKQSMDDSSIPLTIDWLVEKPHASLLREIPLISRLIVFDTHAPRSNPCSIEPYADLFKSLKSLRRVRYDVTVDLQRLTKSAVIHRLCRTDRRIGFDAASCRESTAGWGLDLKASINYESDPIQEQYKAPLELAAGRRLTLPPPPHLIPSSAAVNGLSGKLDLTAKKPLVIALPGGGFTTKVWPLEHWVELLRGLIGRAIVVVPWHGPEERQSALQLADRVRDLIVPPALSLPELAALLYRADLAVGGDTGPIHLAEAVGTETVSFYGPTRASRNGPPHGVHIQSPVDCTGCVKRTCPKAVMDCLTAIKPDLVLAAVLKGL